MLVSAANTATNDPSRIGHTWTVTTFVRSKIMQIVNVWLGLLCLKSDLKSEYDDGREKLIYDDISC